MPLAKFRRKAKPVETEQAPKERKQSSGTFSIINDKGLHTRPATELVKCTTKFKSHIELTFQNITVNGKSLLGILMLAAARGSKIEIEADGEDADEAVQAVINLANGKFNIDY